MDFEVCAAEWIVERVLHCFCSTRAVNEPQATNLNGASFFFRR